jgi:hypothetical protein
MIIRFISLDQGISWGDMTRFITTDPMKREGDHGVPAGTKAAGNCG